jgi:endonuclease/exonuclease/phosphatase family metal-dependent hydrolase
MAQLTRQTGWSAVRCESEPDSSYWYRLVVCSHWPVRFEREAKIPHGHTMTVVVAVPGQPLRLLVVDGESNPLFSRVVMLQEVAATCRRGQERGEPIDILVGDFNTPSRSAGFDPFADSAGGFQLASRSAYGWRGTWPSWCPLFDIDHVWLGNAFEVVGCELFTNSASDHRGQIVHFYLPETR